MRVLKATTFCVLLAASVTLLADAAPDDQQILHTLSRLGYGARPGDIERVRAMGLDRYVESQLEPSRIADDTVAARLAGFETLGLSSREIAARFYTPPQQNPPPQNPPPPQMRQRANLPLLELSQQKLLRAVYSERQLEEVLVDFWFNHFNVFAGKGQFARFYLTEYEREAV
mgnify:CR=1 FL=1